MQRAISNSGERLGSLRDRVMSAAQLARHSVVLDLRAGAGLLTWEALRQVPEGGVVALARTPRDADALREMRDDGIGSAICLMTSAYSSYSGCRQYRENLADAVAAVAATSKGRSSALQMTCSVWPVA
jgi:hypothetical protein